MENKSSKGEHILLPDFRFTKDIIKNSGIKKAYEIKENNRIQGVRVIVPARFDSHYKLLSPGSIDIKFT